MASLYDRTDIYDLFDNESRFQAYQRHWEQVLQGKQVHSLLDVSIGSGNVTLPLAALGIELHGSDLSENMLESCRKKAAGNGYDIELMHSDFRDLNCWKDRLFDCVASTGNSLPHVDNNDFFTALEQMDSLVKAGGYLYLDIRNWDRILRERNRFYLYHPMFDGDTRINVVQVWDYLGDTEMTFHLLYAFEKDNKIFQKEQFDEQYYPIRRDTVLGKLKKLGYHKIETMCFPAFFKDVNLDNVEWYCIMAQKPYPASADR